MISAPTRPTRGPSRRPPYALLLGGVLLAACAATGDPRASDSAADEAVGAGRPRAHVLLKEVEAQLQAAEDARLAFLGAFPVEGLRRARPHADAVYNALDRARAAVAAIEDLDGGPGAAVPEGCCDALETQLARYDAGFRTLVSLAGRRGDGSSGLLLAASDTLSGLERYLDRLEKADATTDRADAIRFIRADVDAIRRFEAAYLQQDDLHSIVSIGDRVRDQRIYLETSALEARERARVDTHVRTYLIFLERVAVTDVQIYRAKRDIRMTTAHIRALLRQYATGADAPLPTGIAI